MKSIVGLTLVAVAAALTGCVVTSVYPFYSEKDLVFEPALLGSWQKVGQPEERWEFERGRANGYRVSCRSEGKTNVGQGHLFMLHGEKFLDFSTAEWKEDIQPQPVPSHLLVRVAQVTPTLKMESLNYDWLNELLARNPETIRHLVIRTGDGSEDRRIVLTADTAELQHFAVKHLKTAEAWQTSLELQRARMEPQPH